MDRKAKAPAPASGKKRSAGALNFGRDHHR